MEARETIHIKSPQVSPRLRYVLSFLSVQLGIDFVFSSQFEDRTLHYSSTITEGAVCIYDSGLLWEKSLSRKEIPVSAKPGNVQLFHSPIGFDLPFDVFSAIFYMLSRYEEYLPFKPDRYGRFEASQSLAGRYGFTDEPVVDRWIGLFRTLLLHRFPGLQIREKKFGFVSTIDVDSPWAYLNKGFLRNAAGICRSLISTDWGEVKNRLSVLKRNKKDPFDVYDHLHHIEDEYGFNSVCFFLSGNYGGYDVNAAFGKPAFTRLIADIKGRNPVGIHPSYRSNSDKSLLAKEVSAFADLLGKIPDMSRQHFLVLKMPETYRNLVSAGIKHDYSMGFASSLGFRAGTSLPFRFYDLGKESETNLTIHPFAVMDVTLQQYLKKDPLQAAGIIKQLIHNTAAVDGIFTWLWHNESLSEHGVWKGWRKVFEEMIVECVTLSGVEGYSVNRKS
jgi:hypothetical protein